MRVLPNAGPAGERLSRFTEALDDEVEPALPSTDIDRPRVVRFRSVSDVYEPRDVSPNSSLRLPRQSPMPPDYTVSLKPCPEPKGKVLQSATIGPSASTTRFPHLLSTALILAFALLSVVRGIPLVRADWFLDRIEDFTGRGVYPRHVPMVSAPQRRQSPATNYCTRWSQQTAIVNGTLYSYGGRASQTAQQTANTWNNDFLTLDLTKDWNVGSPLLDGLPQPSGPPPVANGYLWHSYTSLFLYGGEYSDSPAASPSPYALWEYDIPTQSWTEHSNPMTTAGNNSDSGKQPVQEAAEGAGITIPSLGRGYYFGGHQDFLTTAGWSIQTARIYLKSLLEFTFPGYTNNGVQGLATTPAGGDGAWRNITQGGLQDTDGFTERADGVLVYVPGYGQQGIILGLAGGTNVTFTEMNVIDVFDIASSTWYKQSTQGGPPPIRVNPCAVAASAPDGSSTNVYMYGGQNLQPYKQQIQYGDMWILTVPSFTWIQVEDSNGAPYPRAGHTCEIWDGQIIVVGGYVGTQISCDSPGIYVFDASKLTWQTSFNALSGADDQSQQQSQSETNQGLAGSYGYQVPAIVQSVIGGNGNGGATVTAPAIVATGGPLATGKPIVYTATVSGHVVTETEGSGGSQGQSGGGNTGSNPPNIGAIVAGVIAGILFIIVCYLCFCLYAYRKQLSLYKAHVAAAQRAALAPQREKPFFGPFSRSGDDNRNEPRGSTTDSNGYGTSATANQEFNGSTEGTQPHSQSVKRQKSGASSTAHLEYHEPSFIGVLVRPRRSLRIVNRD